MRFSYLHFFTDLSICRQVCGVRSFDNISYTYDENGIRASKTADGITTKYYLDGTRLIEQSNGTDTLHFTYDRNGEVIGFTHFCLTTGVDDPVMTEYFYLKNVQGDIVGITDVRGNIKARYTYDPWGGVIAVEKNLDSYERDIVEMNPLLYRGYVYDSETGLYYLQSRYYDPEVARFINADDVNYLGATGTQLSYNAFAYCENDVVNKVDPSGWDSYRISKQDFKFDRYGIKILTHYLIGKGKTLIIKDNKKWTEYLKSAKMCGCAGHKKYNSKLTLRQYIGSLIRKKKVNLPEKVFDKKTTKTQAAITNGEGIIGVNYLHGTNAKAGGLKLSIGLLLINNKKYYAVTVTWNDYIDPNFNYSSDSKKYSIAKRLPLVNPTAYTIRIIWTDYYLKLN